LYLRWAGFFFSTREAIKYQAQPEIILTLGSQEK